MTAAQAARAYRPALPVTAPSLAQQALAMGAPGVFSLDQLRAMGKERKQQGYVLPPPPPREGGEKKASLIAGGGMSTLRRTDLPAGYYRIPGVEGAEYYDPHRGQASQAFVDWANGLTDADLDPFTRVPKNFIPAEGGPQALNAARADQSPGDIATFNKIIAGGRGPEGTYQESQDRVLGLGKYQQFMLDANGKQVRVADVLAAAPGKSLDRSNAPFTDLSRPAAGAFDRLAKKFNLTGGALDERLGLTGPKRAADYWTRMEDALASNYERRLEQAAGLREWRVAQGMNPETGISEEKQKQIYETYNRIQDSAGKAAYLEYQWGGNVPMALRQARLDARARDLDVRYDKLAAASPYNVEWYNANLLGKEVKGQIKVTYGPTKRTINKETLLEEYSSGTSAEYVAPESRGRFDEAMRRVGGGLYGAVMGWIGSFGNPLGAVMGGLSGSGAQLNLKKPGKSSWGQAQAPGSIQDIGVALGSAMAFARFGVGDLGFFARVGVGAGIGSVAGMLGSGRGNLGKRAVIGAVMGGVGGGLMGKSRPSWRDKVLTRAGAKIYRGA